MQNIQGGATIKNIFDFATKELSQDAFIRWLLENWDCDDLSVREASKLVLFSFINSKDLKKVESLSTQAQYNKGIDILIDCTVDGVDYVIAVEDKIYTMDHSSQLTRYKNDLDDYAPSKKKVLVFYKTSLVFTHDQKRLAEAGWNLFDIKRLHNIFNSIKIPITNDILCDYVKMIHKKHSQLCGVLPEYTSKWTKETIKHYIMNFYYHYLQGEKGIKIRYSNFRGNYLTLWAVIEGKEGLMPYMAITTRDILKGRGIFKIQLYGVKHNGSEPSEAQVNQWKDRIKSSKFFKVKHHSKLIGQNYDKYEQVNTVNELREKFCAHLDDYANMFKY